MTESEQEKWDAGEMDYDDENWGPEREDLPEDTTRLIQKIFKLTNATDNTYEAFGDICKQLTTLKKVCGIAGIWPNSLTRALVRMQQALKRLDKEKHAALKQITVVCNEHIKEQL